MGTDRKNRRQARLSYEELYSPFWPERTASYLQCFYCGDPAETMDHQPPISQVDAYRTLGLQYEFYVKVPCCRECNGLLGDSLTDDLIDREREVKAKLEARYKNQLRFGSWEDADIDSLGPNLQSAVREGKRQFDRTMARLDYAGGINAWLGKVEFGDEY